MERYSNSTSEMDDVTSLADLIEQLERKRTILVDLDRQISAGVSDDDLEAEILESEEIQSELSSTMAKVKRLMQQFQQVLTHSPRSSSPSQVQQTTRSPSQISQTTRSSSPASSETDTLPTPPQSPVHKEDMAHHHSTKQNPPQRSTSHLDVFDASHTKLHEPQFGINSTVRLPRLDLPTFSGNALEWQPFWDGFNAAVNSNPSISDVQKLNYLRSQLRGEASLVIAGFSLTSANYSHSVVLLKDRYGQPQKLITAHMQALLDLPNPLNTLSSLQSFHDAIERHMRSLSTLGKSVDSYGDLLVPIILSKLPQKTRKNMVRDHDRNEWNLRDLQEAIRKEVRVFESELATSQPPQNLHPTATFHTGATNNPSQPNTVSQRSCAFCKGSHSPTKCEVITDRQARKEFVVQKNLCFNCLGRHKVNICKSKHRCRKCNRKHHTSLCTVDSGPEKQDKKESTADNTTLSTIVSPPATATSLHLAGNNICLLKTAVATISASDTCVEANILFDEGSQRSFITKSLADCLQLQACGTEELSISTFGAQSSHVRKLDVTTIQLHAISGQLIPLTVLIVPTIAAPIQNLSKKRLTDFPYLKGLQLAHPVTSTEQFTINLLIGADHYWDVVEDYIIKGNGPTAMESKLGYLLSGPVGATTPRNTTTNILHVASQPIPDPDLQRFWTVESLGIMPKDHTTKSFMELYMTNSIERLPDGSYSARFPWKESHPALPTNFWTCARRTRSLARKLAKTPLLSKYNEILADQQRRGFIERVHPPDHCKKCHYIPHHAVRKDSTTTPIRIVYDCSCHQSRDQPSLNDCLLSGDPQLNDLCCILLRFRCHPIGICTDIEKAFLHIWLHEDDRDCTRFLWLTDPLDPESEFQTYRFKVVLFGAVCSPFMLNATLHCHLSQYRFSIAQDMLTNLYVDNIVTGCESEEDAILYYNTARSIMKEAQFSLRSWASNNRKLINLAAQDKVDDGNSTVNVLGLQWDTQTDTLSLTCKSPIPAATTLITKREVLRESSKIFDPLGMLSPVTIKAKVFMQKLWQRNMEWDEPLTEGDQREWLDIAHDIEEAMSMSISRQYLPKGSVTKQPSELHIFADASPIAYGAIAFLCVNGNISFIMAKARVAPLKQLTLPKLELMAALTAARISSFITDALKFCNCSVNLWTDSQIVLHWIKGEKRNNAFVTHRITEIHSITDPNCWRYCPTLDNPADLLTRGINSTQLRSSTLWKHGPQWLPSYTSWPIWKPSPTLPLQALAVTTSDFIPSGNNSSNTTGIHCIIKISNYGTLSKLLGVTAYTCRFPANCRKQQEDRLKGPLTPLELHNAQTKWVKQSQEEVYSSIIDHLTSHS